MSDTEFDADAIKALLEAFEESDWDQMTVSIGNDSLQVSRSGEIAAPPPATPAAADTTAAPPPTAPVPQPQPSPAPTPPGTGSDGADQAGGGGAAARAAGAEGTAVESPTVGIFWAAPAPGAPPFVEVGSEVKAEDTVAIVEVMKLMNHVPAGLDGVVTAIAVDNGESVEFGQALVLIDPS